MPFLLAFLGQPDKVEDDGYEHLLPLDVGDVVRIARSLVLVNFCCWSFRSYFKGSCNATVGESFYMRLY